MEVEKRGAIPGREDSLNGHQSRTHLRLARSLRMGGGVKGWQWGG